MKKLLLFVFAFCLIGIFLLSVKADDVPTLQQIAEKFNSQESVKYYESLGTQYVATVQEDELLISVTAEGYNADLTYYLTDNILSFNVLGYELLNGYFVTKILIDSLGQLHGYSEGEMLPTLNSDKIVDYTLEDEGLMMSLSDSNELSVKVDISKKIPLLDLSDEYIEIEDLLEYKEYIVGDGFVNLYKGNLYFNKTTQNNNNVLLIFENNSLTDSSYKSILSAIEVMFESKNILDYFQKNYSSISSDSEFTGFKIEINPADLDAEIVPSGSEDYEYIRVTIYRDEVNSLKFDSDVFESIENPKTGVANYIIFGLVLLVIGLTTYAVCNKRTQKM